jgi:hypothetical protein
MVQTCGYLRELACREMGFSIGVWTLDPLGSPARTNKTPKRRRSIMRYTVLGILVALTMVLVPPFVWAEGSQTETPAEPGKVLMEGGALHSSVDEPESQFQNAHENFLKKDFKGAAAEIRKATAFLKLEAARATGEGKKGITASVDELEKLASDVEKGTVKSAEDMDKAFARAHHALAVHHHMQASEAWAKKETSETGHALKAAASHLEKASAWGGHKIEAAVAKVIETGRDVGEKLIQGGRWTADEVGKALKDLGEKIGGQAKD